MNTFAGLKVIVLPEPHPAYWHQVKRRPWDTIASWEYIPETKRMMPPGEALVSRDAVYVYRAEYEELRRA